MAIILKSGNLNQWGDVGNFEADRSTWGFQDHDGGNEQEIVRYIGDSHKGSASCLARPNSATPTYLSRAKFTYAAGKKYYAKAWIKSPGAPYLLGPDELELAVVNSDSLGVDIITVSTSSKTIGDAHDNWTLLETYFEVKPSPFFSECVLDLKIIDYHGASGVYNPNGYLYTDDFEIFEYELRACALTIDATNTIVQGESNPNASDGKIIVAITGNYGAVEYRYHTDGAWQDGNIFSNIPGGSIPTIYVREKDELSCIASHAFTVNAGQNTLTFTVIVVHESAGGAHDGQITVNAVGTGQPYRYSKDGGANFQSSNVFYNLAPGTYQVMVNSPSAGIITSQYITVNAGAYDFNFTTVVLGVTAEGEDDGSITVTPSGDAGPYTYSSDGGSTYQGSNVLAGLIAGGYVVAVKHTSGVVRTKVVVVGVRDADFSFTVIPVNESIIGAHNGSMTVSVSGIGGPFTYSKDNGATWQSSNTFEALAPGTYQVRVRNAALFALPAQPVIIGTGIIVYDRVWFSRNDVLFAKSATEGWQALENVRIYDDVRVDDATNGTFTSKLKTELPPEADGNVTFVVGEAFRDVLTAVPPAFNASSIVRLTDRIKFFKHYTGQLTGVQQTPVTLEGSLPHLVLRGGLSKLAAASINYFGVYLPTNKKFLTWAPVEKQVDRNQEDYLNFFIYATLTFSLKLRIKAYYDDSTDQTSTVQTKEGVVYGQLYQVPAGPTNSGAAGINPAKNLVRYDLWLTDQNDAVISEVRTYIIDAVSHPNKRFFMFENSLGSYEVLRFTGVAEKTAVVSKDEIVKFLPYNYGPLDSEREINNSTIRSGGNYSTGYLDPRNGAAWLEYLTDFIASRKAFDVTNGKRIPVIIQSATIPAGTDQDYERFIRFNVMDAMEDENFTPRNI